MLIVLVVLLAGVAVLAVPIDVSFTVKREEKFQASATLGWSFGLVRIPLHPGRGKAKPTPRHKAKRARPPRHKLHGWAMLRSKGFLARVVRLLRRLIGCLHWRRLRLHIHLGLDDPADTGRLWGMLAPLTPAVPIPAGTDLRIHPEFSGAVLLIDGEGTLRIVPIEVMATLLSFVLSPVTLRALYALATGR